MREEGRERGRKGKGGREGGRRTEGLYGLVGGGEGARGEVRGGSQGSPQSAASQNKVYLLCSSTIV